MGAKLEKLWAKSIEYNSDVDVELLLTFPSNDAMNKLYKNNENTSVLSTQKKTKKIFINRKILFDPMNMSKVFVTFAFCFSLTLYTTLSLKIICFATLLFCYFFYSLDNFNYKRIVLFLTQFLYILKSLFHPVGRFLKFL